MSGKKEKEVRKEEVLVITITAEPNKALRWSLSKQGISTDEFIYILRAIQDELFLEKAIQRVRQIRGQDMRMHKEADKIMIAKS